MSVEKHSNNENSSLSKIMYKHAITPSIDIIMK